MSHHEALPDLQVSDLEKLLLLPQSMKDRETKGPKGQQLMGLRRAHLTEEFGDDATLQRMLGTKSSVRYSVRCSFVTIVFHV